MFEDSKILLILIAAAGFYIVIRLFSFFSKAEKTAEDQIEAILNSEEYKVKGRFD